MKYDYKIKIDFLLGEPFDVNYINNVCRQRPDTKVLVEVPNTVGIKSSDIRRIKSDKVAIRIAGAYDKERLNIYKDQIFGNEDCKAYYFDSVIYTKNEVLRIMEAMEKIEADLVDNWSPIQKVIYIYDKLKRGIMYDPKFEKKFSSEIRSLRGLITKQTVCAGYAVIFKEMLDRQGIKCDFIRGNGHAWNIVTIDGKMYPFDLTWDNSKFRAGKSNTFDFLGQNIDEFNRAHKPDKREPMYGYQDKLSQINPILIKKIANQIGIARDYQSTTYYGVRKDGSRFIVAQIGDSEINNSTYCRYYYVDVQPNGTHSLPLILYSETNLTHLVDAKRFGKNIPDGYEEAVDNILFSRENISNSLAMRTYFIGNVMKKNGSNKPSVVNSISEIEKSEQKKGLFVYPTRRFRRSDGTVFIAQQMWDTPKETEGVNIMRYDILEMVNKNGVNVLKKNIVYTEMNLFKDNRQDMIDNLLSRSRLDRKVGEAGGYIGYYDKNGTRVYNPDLVNFFKITGRIDINPLDLRTKSTSKQVISIPSFEELKRYASRYELFVGNVDDEGFGIDISKFKIIDRKSGQTVTDDVIVNRALLANLWLSAAALRFSSDERISGARYAFSDTSERLYNIICRELLDSVKRTGVIDTIGLFRDINSKISYRDSQEIIVRLFRTPYQTKLINSVFLNANGMIDNQQQTPEALYSLYYAGGLAYGDGKDSGRHK